LRFPTPIANATRRCHLEHTTNGPQKQRIWVIREEETVEAPACPSCGRLCDPGATWKGVNYCRGFALLSFIEQNPGLSAWELSQLAGMAYPHTSSALAKLHERKVVDTEAEERAEGGFRYRYWSAGDSVALDRFIATLHLVEANQ
jgi:hypothetical protein